MLTRREDPEGTAWPFSSGVGEEAGAASQPSRRAPPPYLLTTGTLIRDGYSAEWWMTLFAATPSVSS